MKRIAAALVFAAVCLGHAGPVRAGPSITVTDVSVTGDAVHITGPISPIDTIAGPLTLGTSVGTLIAWCVDLYHEVYTGGGQNLAYQVGTVTTNNAPSPATLTAAQLRTIGQLAQYGQSLIGTSAGTNDALAAVQLAIWSTEYSSFAYTGASGASVSNALAASSGYSANDAGLLALNGTQTFVTASPAVLTAVPEPSGVFVLALALPALALVRRRAAA